MKNSHLNTLPIDYLYHLGLDSSQDLKGKFGDVKCVCMMGSPTRIAEFAKKIATELAIADVEPIGKTERCSIFKVGPVLCVSHGMGAPSILIFLHELVKLLDHAQASNVSFIRIGTSGTLGLTPGTVIISSAVLNGKFEPQLEQIGLGKSVCYPTHIHQPLAQALMDAKDDIHAEFGITLGTDDFYEGQGRLDGAVQPPYTEEERTAFLHLAYEKGVRNIEMESTAFSAFCHRAGIPAAIVCATFINRLQGDQVTTTAEQQHQFTGYADQLVLQFFRKSHWLTK